MSSIARVLTARRAFIELAAVAVRIVTSDIEKSLCDRQRGAQLVGGVGGEPLLLGISCFELYEHGVEGIKFTELVVASLQFNPVRQPPAPASRAARVIRSKGASIRPARIQPPTRPNTSKNPSAKIAAGTNTTGPKLRGSNTRAKSARSGNRKFVAPPLSRKTQTAARSKTPASMRNPA
ncbi:hypothetical protein BDB13_5918 [Rhodococcus sp. OK302]|nr:hypothetical protein BDB13_5918 [Rhodococcus sp. OK302]